MLLLLLLLLLMVCYKKGKAQGYSQVAINSICSSNFTITFLVFYGPLYDLKPSNSLGSIGAQSIGLRQVPIAAGWPVRNFAQFF